MQGLVELADDLYLSIWRIPALRKFHQKGLKVVQFINWSEQGSLSPVNLLTLGNGNRLTHRKTVKACVQIFAVNNECPIKRMFSTRLIGNIFFFIFFFS